MPQDACVGAMLDLRAVVPALRPLRPAQVVYLPAGDAPVEALRRGLWHVVLSTSDEIPELAPEFEDAGWEVRPLGDYWKLASWPNVGDARC